MIYSRKNVTQKKVLAVADRGQKIKEREPNCRTTRERGKFPLFNEVVEYEKNLENLLKHYGNLMDRITESQR